MENQPAERMLQREQWVASQLATHSLSIEPASADASFRSYWRVRIAARSWILMDAPPGKEDIVPFIDIGGRLRQAGLHAPIIYGHTTELGFILLEDLGTRLFSDALAPVTVEALYGRALDALAIMQGIPTTGLPNYNDTLLRAEVNLFRDWLLGRHLQLALGADFEAAWERLTQQLIDNALVQPKVFVHRDFHCRNLMDCENEPPGIIDFQDAVCGPVTYDLVSLLRDCYIAWPPSKVMAWVRRAHRRVCAAGLTNSDWPTWQRWFDLMGLQRHLKASGIFCRLYHRDNKPAFLKDIPRTLRYIQPLTRSYRELAWFAPLVTRALEAIERQQR